MPSEVLALLRYRAGASQGLARVAFLNHRLVCVSGVCLRVDVWALKCGSSPNLVGACQHECRMSSAKAPQDRSMLHIMGFEA